ncbi:MAG: hypothetical protein MUF81_18555 [Verrucomicrobia bacterium]|jgi:hypothetical protein|nr:hypothetical protein [Verrucomicrobiota bacterium]
MNRRQKPPQRQPKNPAYRQAFERLDESLAENTKVDTIERIQMARLALFGCAPDTVVMPE